MRRVRPLVLVLALTALAACRDGAGQTGDVDDVSRPTGRTGKARTEPGMGAELETFVAAPDYAVLTRLLGQGHAVARARFGPHELRYAATIRTGPRDLGDDEAVPDVGEDQPVIERFVVHDELALVWGSSPDEPARLSLDQHNEHEHGRALILLGEREWVELDGRGWFERPLETDLWQLWADDAQAAVLDLVELAGPDAELGAVELDELDGRPVVRVSLRPSEQRHPERTVEGPTPWRHDATVELVAATIVLDRATGLWRRASIELGWNFKDSAHREVVGRVQFEGSVDPLAQAPVITPPAIQAPLPELDRPELLRERLLDGLAGP